MIFTVFFRFLRLFLSSLHLQLVGLLIDGIKDCLSYLLLPSLWDRQRKVLIQFLISLRQLQRQHIKHPLRKIMPGFHHSVAVSPLPLRKFRKNYVSAVRITLLTWKIPLRRCRCHLPLRRITAVPYSNRIESYFCCYAVGGQPISVLVTYVYGKTFPAFPFSPAAATV